MKPTTIARTYPWKSQLLSALPLCFVLIAILFTVGTGETVTRYFSLVRQDNPMLTKAIQFFSDIGIPLLYTVMVAMLFRAFRKGNKPLVTYLVCFACVQILIELFIIQALKISIGRPRPMTALEDIRFTHWAFDNNNHSFPSSHTAKIVAASSTLALLGKNALLSISLGIIAAVVGFSRIYLSRHHPSDVFAGLCIGILTSFAVFYLFNRKLS